MYLYATLFVFLAIFLSYSPALNGPWALDDIVVNRSLSIDDLSSIAGYRSISMLSFRLNQTIGGLNPLAYRIVNLIIHGINSLLLLWLSHLTLRRFDLDRRVVFSASVLISVTFALHPLNINAVTYIVQRMASLACMFVLLALISYYYAVTSKSLFMKAPLYTLSLSFMLLGVLSKENAIVAPLLILLYDCFFISASDQRRAFLRRALIALIIGGAAISISFFMLGLGDTLKQLLSIFTEKFNVPVEQYPWVATDAFWSPKEHILTEFRVICRYLFLILLPLPGLLVFDYWGYPISKGFLDPPHTLLAFLIILIILISSILFHKRVPLLSFGLLWYFLSISLESFIAIGSDIYFEHRNYLPLTGLLLGLVSYLVMRFLKSPSYPKAWTAAIILSLLLGGLTFQRNLTYRDSSTLWMDTLKKAPSNIRAMVALGNYYLSRTEFESARTYYRKAIQESAKLRKPTFFTSAAFSLGMINLYTGDTGVTEGLLTLMERTTVDNVFYRTLKGFYLMQKNRLQMAIKELKLALQMPSRDVEKASILTLLGDAYLRRGDHRRAESYYMEALKLVPGHAPAYYGIAQIRLRERKPSEAKRMLEMARESDPDNPLVLADLAEVLLLKGRLQEAEKLARQALLHSPPFRNPYLTMGNILVYEGKEEEAERYYRMAVQRGASRRTVLLGMARSYYLRGDIKKAEEILKEVQGAGTPDNK